MLQSFFCQIYIHAMTDSFVAHLPRRSGGRLRATITVNDLAGGLGEYYSSPFSFTGSGIGHPARDSAGNLAVGSMGSARAV
jgi:hypothetical protein